MDGHVTASKERQVFEKRPGFLKLRKHLFLSALSEDAERSSVPVDVIEAHPDDVARPEAETDEKEEHCSIAEPVSSASRTRVQEALHFIRFEVAGQLRQAPLGQAGNSLNQIR